MSASVTVRRWVVRVSPTLEVLVGLAEGVDLRGLFRPLGVLPGEGGEEPGVGLEGDPPEVAPHGEEAAELLAPSRPPWPAVEEAGEGGAVPRGGGRGAGVQEVKPPHVGGEGQEVKARLLGVGGGEGGHEASPAQSGKPRRLLPASVGEEGGHGAEGLHLVEGPGPGVLGEEEGGGKKAPSSRPGCLQ